MSEWHVSERFIPLDGDRADDARADLERLAKEYASNPHARIVGMVETRSLSHKTPRTTAKWCAVLRVAECLGGAEGDTE